MAIHRTRDTMQERHGLGAISAPHVTRTRRTSRNMRRASSLALALSVCALATPALAHAAATPSPFKADRASSVPSGLTPNSVAAPLTFPEKPVILTWGEVPGAVGYTVEVSDTPGFAAIAWKADTVQPIAVPETLLPDGQYWWRVKAVERGRDGRRLQLRGPLREDLAERRERHLAQRRRPAAPRSPTCSSSRT